MSEIGETKHDDGTLICSAVFALAFPPAAGNIAWVAKWNRYQRPPTRFGLSVWCTGGPISLTDFTLYGGSARPHTIADDTFTADNTTEIFTATGHGLKTGDGPIQLTTTGTLPAGLALATDYFVIRIDANTFYLATSRKNALQNTKVLISDNGTGTHTLVDTAETRRMHWHNYGKLGQQGDGSVSVDDGEGYAAEPNHLPSTIAYALKATFSASDPEALSAAVYPIFDSTPKRGG